MATKKKSAGKKAAPKKAAKRKGSAPAAAASKTCESPAYPPGRGGQQLKPTPKPFTKENQPPPEVKKAGWARRKALKELIEFQMCGKLEGSKKDYPALTASFYGIDVKDVTIRMIMEFRQIEKAILKGDTGAFNAVMDRAVGKAKQAIELIPDMTIRINGKVIRQKQS